jgi:small subunit ribosomal protein S6
VIAIVPRAVAGLYDLMVILDPNAPDGRHEAILGDVRSMVEGSGTLVGEHDWGLRRLAYEIDHRGDGAYHLFQFEGGNDLLERLDHMLKITDGVLRFRIIKLKPGSPPPPAPRQDAPRPREQARPGTSERVAARAAADAG